MYTLLLPVLPKFKQRGNEDGLSNWVCPVWNVVECIHVDKSEKGGTIEALRDKTRPTIEKNQFHELSQVNRFILYLYMSLRSRECVCKKGYEHGSYTHDVIRKTMSV